MAKILAIFLLFLSVRAAHGQVPQTSDLYRDILRADQTLLDRGFNQCDQKALDEIIDGNFSFFHDQNGTKTSKAAFLKDFNQSICSNPNRKPIRKLVAGSMLVFPLHNEGKLYGAIQMAVHDFYIREPGKDLVKTNIGRVANVWILAEGKWRLKTSLSYDHHSPGPADRFDANYPEPLFDQGTRIDALIAAQRFRPWRLPRSKAEKSMN